MLFVFCGIMRLGLERTGFYCVVYFVYSAKDATVYMLKLAMAPSFIFGAVHFCALMFSDRADKITVESFAVINDCSYNL